MTQKITKRDNFLKAVQRLTEALEEYRTRPSELARDGIIQRFEFTFELSWKALKEHMEDLGASGLQFPKQVLKEAYRGGLISNEKVWLSMLDARNMTSHIYNSDQAAKILAAIRDEYTAELLSLVPLFKAK